MCVSVDGFGTHNGEVSISERELVKIKRVKGTPEYASGYRYESSGLFMGHHTG